MSPMPAHQRQALLGGPLSQHSDPSCQGLTRRPPQSMQMAHPQQTTSAVAASVLRQAQSRSTGRGQPMSQTYHLLKAMTPIKAMQFCRRRLTQGQAPLKCTGPLPVVTALVPDLTTCMRAWPMQLLCRCMTVLDTLRVSHVRQRRCSQHRFRRSNRVRKHRTLYGRTSKPSNFCGHTEQRAWVMVQMMKVQVWQSSSRQDCTMMQVNLVVRRSPPDKLAPQGLPACHSSHTTEMVQSTCSQRAKPTGMA